MASRALVARPASAAGIAWRRLGRRCLLGALAVVAVAQVWLQSRHTEYGYDFRGGTWAAGHAVLAGRSPFPPPLAHALIAHSNAFITPPPLALLGVPFSLLGFGPAIVAFNLLCTAGLIGALRLLDVRDRAVWVVALCTFPFVASLCLGQPDGIFALGAAAAWRWRGRWPGALAAAAIIAAKLLAWPLILWLLVTRRFRQAAIAAAGTGAILVVSWACVGFRGLLAYPRLLAADAHVFGPGSHSIVTVLVRAGLGQSLAMTLTVPLAVILAALVVGAGRGTDLAWFTAALTLGILCSPVLWQHYLVLLFVALAATRRPRDPVVWGLAALLWLSPVEPPPTLVQAALVPGLAAAIAARISWLGRPRAG